MEGGTVINHLIVGFGASCLGKTLLAFFLLGLLNLANPTFLAVELLFIDDLVELSFLKINSVLSALLSLVELLTLAELTALVEELLFIYILAGLALASLILKMGLIPIKGLVELVVLLLVLLNYLVKSPFIEFSSLKLSQAVTPKESTSFFPEIQVFALLIPFNNSFALILNISVFLFCS